MTVGTTLRSWSATAANNNPKGTDIIGTSADDELRQIQATVRQYLASQASSVVAAATTDLSTVDGHLVPISGNSTITGLGTEAAGIEYVLNFSGSPILVHSSALQLPGQATINATVGDMCVAESLGSGNWKVWGFTRGTGFPLFSSPQAANALLAGPASGAAAVPTFRSLVGAESSLVLITAQSASASAQIDFTTGIGSTYDEYLVVITDLIPATDNTNLQIRVSEDGGATFKAGAGNYAYTMVTQTDAGATPSGSGDVVTATFIRAATNIGNTVTKTFSGEVRFWNPSGTSKMKQFKFESVLAPSGATQSYQAGSGQYSATANAINAIRFLMSAGNITSGNFALYGVRKT